MLYKIDFIQCFHYLIDIKKVWLFAVANNLTTDSLSKFTAEYKGKKLFDFIENEHYNDNPYENRVHIVNCKELGVKDIILLLPKLN